MKETRRAEEGVQKSWGWRGLRVNGVGVMD